MPTKIRFSLRDKFLVSFLGLAIVLTGMLTMLASEVGEILPELSISQSERYKAQLLLRDMREAILIAAVPDNLDLIGGSDVVLEEKLHEYENSLTISVSPGVYEALVSEERVFLANEEEQQLSSLRRNIQLYGRYKDSDPASAHAALQRVVEQSKELEKLNQETIMVLDQAQKSTQRYVLTFFLISLAILLLGITVFAQLLAMWITYPLRKIQQAATKIAEGDLSHELKPDSQDELGLLMESFDDMRRKVLASLDEVRAFARRDEMLINSIVDIIIAVDPDLNIILFNVAAEAVSGWSAIGAIHKPLKSILHFDGLDNEGEEETIIRHVIESGQSQSLLKPVLIRGSKKERSIPVTMSVAPFVEGEGERGAVIVLRDVSENMELDKLREEFVSITSHQLRTPLTAIRWLLEVLIRGENERKIDLNPKHRDTLHQAYARTLSMSELVSSLLALSRVDAQKVKAKYAPISMHGMFDKIDLSMKATADRKGVSLRYATSVDKDIMADEVILMQILTNVVGNAIKYSREGGEVSLEADVAEGKLHIAVKDNGIGVPLDQQKSIFKKFYRAKNALMFTPEGTGIGLYMVKAFTELLGGDIRFESKENEGTTFHLTFPLQYAHG